MLLVNDTKILELYKRVYPMDWEFIKTEKYLCFDKEFDCDTKQVIGSIFDFYYIEPIHVHERLSTFYNLLTQNTWISSHIISFHKGIESHLDLTQCEGKYIYIFSNRTVSINMNNTKYTIKPNVVFRIFNKPFHLKSLLNKSWHSILIYSNDDFTKY